MRVARETWGKRPHFENARQLHQHDPLEVIFSSPPRSVLPNGAGVHERGKDVSPGGNRIKLRLCFGLTRNQRPRRKSR